MNEESLFAAALRLPTAGQRAAFLDEACGGDARLRARVECLLAANEHTFGILDQCPDTARHDGTHPASPAGPPLAAGQVFAGRSRLLRKLGEGGMGEVWAADQTEPVHRLVALKVIRPGLDSARMLARFDRERQALALMDHPNIATVLDAGIDAGRPYFVMELIRGQPITQYCDEARLSVRERLELFIPVCRAVQHAHQKGIIHRDVKPSNILVAVYDGKPVPKVIDFGIAKATGPVPGAHGGSTEVGVLVGTLEYMSPEQAELNAIDIDTRCDVYALGVVLYELLAARVPFSRRRLQSAGLAEMLRIIKEVEPPAPSARLSGAEGAAAVAAARRTEPKKLAALVRGELDWIVMKCLEKDRTRRYETANGLALDLQRHLADEPVEASPPSTAYRVRKFLRRNRGPVLAAATIVFLLVVGIVGTSVGLVRTAEARQAEAERACSSGRARDEAEERLAHTEERLAAALRRLIQLSEAEGDSEGAAGWARELEALETRRRSR